MGRLIKSLAVIVALVGIVIGLYFLAPARTDPLAPAKDAIDRRDFSTAREALDRHLEQNPKDKDALFLAARTARRDGDGAAAEAYLLRYLNAGGSNDDAQLERVLRESQEGNVANADRVIAHCTQNPDDPNASLLIEALARGLRKLGTPTIRSSAAFSIGSTSFRISP
jgi:thioredoxin-like negative regulator of GroEL